MRLPLLENLLGTVGPEQQKRLHQCLRRLSRPAWLGSIRRITPLSDRYGYDRGLPVDRYYIESFLADHRQDIHGCVLEVKDTDYTDRYGINIERRDVLDIDRTNQHATIIADLAAADAIPSNSFDCFILTQALQFIYDTRAAIFHSHRILRSGGVLLATVPAVSRVVPKDRLADYWRFTVTSCSALFGQAFGSEQIVVRSYGNVLTAIAFLTGMAREELSRGKLETNDESFPLIITVRAVKQQ